MSTLKERLRTNLRKFEEEQAKKVEDIGKEEIEILKRHLERVKAVIVSSMLLLSEDGGKVINVGFNPKTCTFFSRDFFTVYVNVSSEEECTFFIAELSKYFIYEHGIRSKIITKSSLQYNKMLVINLEDQDDEDEQDGTVSENLKTSKLTPESSGC